ncbi:MAG: phosphoglycerate dehydrogenase [Acidobacteria bacterium]|nr:phosphoglycerate dehydrogenase [Acidobacteriota bacterium]
MKVVIADELPRQAVAVLEGVEGWQVEFRPRHSRQELTAMLADADALIVRSATQVDRELLDAAPRLRVVARAGTGVDNVAVEEATRRGIVVMNAPGANSVSVAEHACGMMLALSRSIPAADAAMKQQRWDKKRFTGSELAGKTLGLVGLGRVGQEVARRASAFGMEILAHDPYISEQLAADLGVTLVSLDEVCTRADYLSLHLPLTSATRRLFDAERLATCRRGVRMINTARGELIDSTALAAALASGQVGGAGLDVFEQEPPKDWALVGLPQVIATPHIAASTREAQEMVAAEITQAVRDFLRDGIVRNAVNFPTLPPEQFHRLKPYLTLAERLGTLAIQVERAHVTGIGIRYYGELVTGPTEHVTSATLVGLLRPILSSGITLVNARSVASQRGMEVVESRSTRSREFTSLISLKLRTSDGERWLEGTVFEPERPRLVLLDGVNVEAPLEGTMIIIWNNDQPGVIGDVGTILGHHGINISSFALGRSDRGAVGVVNVDEQPGVGGEAYDRALEEIRKVAAVRQAGLVRL